VYNCRVDLPTIIRKLRWTPRAAFPPSVTLSMGSLGTGIFTCGDGLYLLSNSDYGEGDPVVAVGWAESDYWAKRTWDNPPFRGDLTAPQPEWRPPPSLAFLGRPQPLSYASIRDFEGAQPGARKATLLDATYRMTDGAFLYCTINGAQGITYVYASNHPKPNDEPVALEFQLPDAS